MIIEELGCHWDDVVELEKYLRDMATRSKVSSKAGQLHFAADVVKAYRGRIKTTFQEALQKGKN